MLLHDENLIKVDLAKEANYARVIGDETAKMIVDEWLNAKFEGGRHAERVALITEIEQTQALASRGE